ncbi:MAG: GNAT family N-acetyltransferase [Candidatus Zixiibacteriota bacterium]
MNPDKTTIREVELQDVDSIVNLHRKVVAQENGKCYSPEIIKEWLSQISPKSVSQQLSIKDTPWYLIEDDGRLVGFSQFSIEDKTFYQINIDPEFKGKGYGKKLYQFIEDRFRSAGVDKIELWSTINAKEFYEKQGFTVVQKIKTKLINTEMDEFFMEKAL